MDMSLSATDCPVLSSVPAAGEKGLDGGLLIQAVASHTSIDKAVSSLADLVVDGELFIDKDRLK